MSLGVGTASSQLAMPCYDFNQLKVVIPLLLEHSIISAEERVCKLIIQRSKVCLFVLLFLIVFN